MSDATRSPFDHIVQRQSDGFSRDFWESDSRDGRARIAKREAAAAAGMSDAQLRSLVHAEIKGAIDERFAKAFAPEQKGSVANTLIDVMTSLAVKVATDTRKEWQDEFHKLRLEIAEEQRALAEELLTIKRQRLALAEAVEEQRALAARPRALRGAA